MNSSESSVSFIVFALNEETEIEPTVNTLREAVKGASVADYEIVLVNDGSTDNTGRIMDALASADNRIIAVHNETNLGPGGALKKGVAAAHCDYFMAIAGDNAAPIASIRKTIEHLGEADIIISYASNPEVRSFRRRFGSNAFKSLINLLFGYRMPYYNGAVPRRKLFNEINIRSDGYAFFAEMVVKLMRKGASYVPVGVEHTVDANASSSALKLTNVLNVLKDIMNLIRDVWGSPVGRLPERSNSPLS